jgi:hypothetical protein
MQGLRILWQVVFALDPLHACLALGPLGVYLSLIGALNLAGRPLIVSGTRDMAALGLAVSGFVIVGPLELCLPDAAAVRFGPYVWVLLLVFYALCLILALLLLRPRLVIYNVSADQLRAVLADLTDQLDSDARWAGDALALPRLGVQLHLDNVPLTRNVSLTPVGIDQDPLGWARLQSALAAALGRVSIARNPRGAVFAAVGLAIILALAYSVACDPQAVAQALLEMLRI